MAKSFGPVTPVACNVVDTKYTLKSANVKGHEVPTSFTLLKQKSPTAVVPPLADGVRLVTIDEYKQAAACLAEAFAEDEVARYFVDVPDREDWTEEERYALHLEILEYITYAHILKGLVTTVGDFEAVALWHVHATVPSRSITDIDRMPPGQNMDDYITIFRSGMWRLNYRLSPEGKRRFFNEFFPLLHDTMHATLGDRELETWYLVYLGTRPAGRGKGHARKLITHVTKLADGEGRACYLESSNAANPAIYRKFGFEERRTIHLQRAQKNISLDIMVREPVVQEKKAGF
jgi:GNAT superfamily N-acetyltransferase